MKHHQRIDSLKLVFYCATAIIIQSAVAILGIRFPEWFGFSPSIYVFSDLNGYHSYARMLSIGLLPYGNFTFEYPPLAMPFFAIPWVFASGFGSYIRAFTIQMLAINTIAVWCVAGEVRRSQGVERVPGRLAWYTAYFVILCPLIVTRFDLAPMLLAFLAATWFGRNRIMAGANAAAVGALVKFVPVLALLPRLASPLPLSSKVRSTAPLLILAGIWIAALYILGSEQSVSSLRYHSERGIEIGSVYASGYMLCQRLGGMVIGGRFDHQSINVYGPGSEFVARLSIVPQCGCLLLVAWRTRLAGSTMTVPCVGALLLAYMVTGKVLSPQYLIWLIPFVVVARSGQSVFLICCILTTAIFPWNFKGLEGLEPWPEYLQIGRNLGLIGLFAIMLRESGQIECTVAEG